MRKLVNTREFQRTALEAKKNKGLYTLAPKDSYEYVDFWKEEHNRCMNGYSVGGMWISGKHYAYLNYGVIERLATEEELKKNPFNKMVYERPRFFYVDYEYWMLKHICQFGATKSDLKKYGLDFLKEPVSPGKHLSILKTRRGGFSYKEAFEGVYNMNFIPGSKSHYFAATEEALVKDGIINKVVPMLDYMRDTTEFGKLRQVKNSMRHMRNSYLDQDGIERGFKSEIFATPLDKPDNARGKAGLKVTFEEGGSFPNLLQCLIICKPQVEQAGIVKGYITVFGTGGNKSDEGIEGLQYIHENPEVYGFLSVDNIWEDDDYDTCGYFVPATMVRENHMDVHGNLDIISAEKEVLKERDKVEKTGNSEAIIKTKAEQPLTPSEALARVSTNFFPTEMLKKRKKYLERNKDYINQLWIPGTLEYDDNESKDTVSFYPDSTLNSVDMYPIDKSQDLTSCIRIRQRPMVDSKGKIPKDLYSLCIDPYAVDDSEDSASIGSIRVIKRRLIGMPNDGLENMIVARYDARPKTVDEFWEVAFKLAIFYNTKIQSELAGGGQIGISRARLTNNTNLLRPQLTISDNKYVTKVTSYFIKTNSLESKSQGVTKLDSWLREVVDYDEEGNKIHRAEKLDDLPLIRELIKFKFTGNFDRVSAMIVAMHDLEERANKDKKRTNSNDATKKKKRFINCH